MQPYPPTGDPEVETLRVQIRVLRCDPGQMAERVEILRRALERVKRETYGELWAGLQIELGVCLAQMDAEGPVIHGEEALGHFTQALEVFTRSAHPERWASIQQNLGTIYRRRVRGGPQRNQERAIACYQCALEVFRRETWPQQWAACTFNLANASLQRIAGPLKENLDTAISLYESVLAVWTRAQAPVRWAEVQRNLGTAWKNYRWGDDAGAHVEKAIEYYRAALEVLSRQEHPEAWAQVQHALGTAWRSRLQGDRRANIEEAIRCYQAALQERSRDRCALDWAETAYDLAVAKLQRNQSHRAADVEEAIRLLEEVRNVRSLDGTPLAWADATNALGNAYVRRIGAGRLENLEAAIGLYQQALDVQRREGAPRDWGPTAHNLAVAYSERLVGDPRDNLARALEHGNQALKAFERDEVKPWTTIATDLVNILWQLAKVESPGDAERYSDEAIALGKAVLQALNAAPSGERRALVHYLLGNVYADHPGRKRTANQKQAILHYTHALEFYTEENDPVRWANTHNNLGVTYLERQDGTPADNRQRAIAHLNKALQVQQPDTLPLEAFRAARNLGNVHFSAGEWSAAHDAYEVAIAAAERLYQATVVEASRQAELAQARGLFASDAYCLARCKRLTEAVKRLETGRARSLAEALALDRAALSAASPADRQRLEDARQRVKRLEGEATPLPSEPPSPGARPLREIANDLQAARNEMARIVNDILGSVPVLPPAGSGSAPNAASAAIRGLSGYNRFSLSATFAEIQDAAAAVGALVYLAATPAEGFALLVTGSRQDHAGKHGGPPVSAIWLPGLTELRLQEVLEGSLHESGPGGYLGAYRRWLADRKNDSARAGDTWRAALDDITRWLWDELMGPVVGRLGAIGCKRVALIPAGLLGLLPLHAAWYEDAAAPAGRRYALDALTISYAPSARSLEAAQETATRVAPTGLLAVGNPDGTLGGAAYEVDAVLAHFPAPHGLALRGGAATHQAVLEQLACFPVCHIAAHGRADWDEPLEGGLSLARNASLKARELLELRLTNTRLVVLSACETGVPGTRLPDEVIGLPTALLQAGAASVAASLWAVSDVSTAVLMERFYRLWREDGLEPVEALAGAQRWLRAATAGSMDLAGHYEAMYRASAKRDALAFRAMLYYRANPDARPFQHPVFWAAFYFTGR